jgi:hypothetical protein
LFQVEFRLQFPVSQPGLGTPIPQTLYFTGCTAEYKQLQSPEAKRRCIVVGVLPSNGER